MKHPDYIRSDRTRQGVLDPNLNHARSPTPRGCQQGTEIQVVGEQDIATLSRPGQELRIGCPRVPDGTPMNARKPSLLEE